MRRLYFGILFGSAFMMLISLNANAQYNFAEAQMQMQAQLKSTADERFAMIDKKNKDYITHDEYVNSTVGKNNMQNDLLFEDMDADKDGKVTLDEYYTGLSVWNYKLIVKVVEAEEKAAKEKAAKEKEAGSSKNNEKPAKKSEETPKAKK